MRYNELRPFKNGEEYMDHDIVHCAGLNCPLKEDCLRYKAHKELLKLGLEKMFYYYCDPDYNPTTQTCKMMLWKEK
jgi:hypothetical protein